VLYWILVSLGRPVYRKKCRNFIFTCSLQVFIVSQLNAAVALLTQMSVIQGQAAIMLGTATCSSLSVIFTKQTICVHYVLTLHRDIQMITSNFLGRPPTWKCRVIKENVLPVVSYCNSSDHRISTAWVLLSADDCERIYLANPHKNKLMLLPRDASCPSVCPWRSGIMIT